MYIKKIVICGFRSFHYCEIENISPGQNVIIGPNGSGKSNIVLALDFVFTKNHIRLTPEQKSLLMCRQPRKNQAKTVETYVEVHLDNSDQRFPLKEATVTVRRRITIQTDQYHINGKLIGWDDLVAILENAGFSLNNSYYIVKQGLIAEVAMSSPRDLLDILRSISGAQSFDEKKAKSLQLIAETEANIESIEEKIQLSKEQLASFNIDEDKVEQYQRYTRIKKYVMVKMKKISLRQLKSTLVQMETELEQMEKTIEQEFEIFVRVEKRLNQVQDEHDRLERETEATQAELKCSIELIEILYSELNKLERDPSSLDDEDGADMASPITADQIDSVRDQLRKLETEIESGAADLSALEEKEKQLAEQIQMLEQRKKDMYKLFALLPIAATDADRDRMIRDRFLDHLETEINEQKAKVAQYRLNVGEFKTKTDSIRKFVEDASNAARIKLNRIATLKQDITKFCCASKMATIEKRKCLNELNKLRKESMAAENRLMETEKWLDYHTGQMAIASKRSIEQCLERLRTKLDTEPGDEERYRLEMIIEGYHGQVVDCFELTKIDFRYALEILVKNKMFFHIVSTETVASQLLTEMAKLGMVGSFKFVAANRIIFNDVQIVEAESQLCQPLAKYVRVIRHNVMEIDMALKRLFHGLFVARNFEACWSLIQTSNNCDFATLHGEMIDRFGVVTKLGTDQPTRYEKYRLWMENRQEVEDLQNKIKELETKRDRLIEESLNFQHQVTGKHVELAELKQWFQESTTPQLSQAELSLQLDRLQKQTNAARTMLQEAETLLSCLLEEKHFWEEKIGCQVDLDFENRRLEDLTRQIDSLRHQYHRTVKERMAKESEDARARARIFELNKQLAKMKYLQLNRSLFNQQTGKMNELKATLLEQIEEARQSFEQLNQKFTELQQHRVEMLQSSDDDNLAKLKERYEEVHTRYEWLYKQYQVKREQAEDVKNKISAERCFIENAGLFSSDFIATLDQPFRQLDTMGDINAALVEVNHQLKLNVGGKVNRELLRRYQEIKERIDDLINAKDQHQIHVEEVKQFIESIELHKTEIIMLTYRQVNVNFQQIFKRFVPNGCVQLQFLNSASSNGGCATGSISSSENRSLNTSVASSSTDLSGRIDQSRVTVDQFEGIEIMLSFTSDQQPDIDLMSLSGGQKALVSLAFIFALQQVDPMPFYVFDEADQNLDEAVRYSVSEMVRKQVAGKKQFIMTTFRTQLLQNADQVFQVKHLDGVSVVEPTTKEAAMEFLSRTRDQED